MLLPPGRVESQGPHRQTVPRGRGDITLLIPGLQSVDQALGHGLWLLTALRVPQLIPLPHLGSWGERLC